MRECRVAVLQDDRIVTRNKLLDGGQVILRDYCPLELFNKWINSDLGVAIIEQILRHIFGDPVKEADLKKLVLNHTSRRNIHRSDAYLEIYYEVRYAFWYGEKNILIDCDEAGALIESRIIKVSCKGDSLDIVTILNEKEVHGKL